MTRIVSKLAAAVLSLSLAAPGMAATDEAAQAALPPDIAKAGVLKVVTSLAYPPMEYTDAGSDELKGFDMDLARAIGDRLGLKVEFTNVEFPQLLPQIATGRSDMLISAFSDKVERRAQVDFIDYFMTGNVFYSIADNQAEIKGLKDLCGKTIAVATGTSWVDWAEATGKEVCGAGEGFNVIQIPTQAEHIMQMRQGRAQASVIGVEGLADLELNDPGKFYQLGEPGDQSPYGIAVDKERPQLRDAILAALNALKADGTYKKIVDQYHLAMGEIDSFVINGAKR